MSRDQTRYGPSLDSSHYVAIITRGTMLVQAFSFCAMAVAHVRVIQALTGEELLPDTELPCANLAEAVRAALGSRPSRPVTLFLNHVLVADAQVAPDDRVEFAAVLGEAVAVEERQEHVQRLYWVRNDPAC